MNTRLIGPNKDSNVLSVIQSSAKGSSQPWAALESVKAESEEVWLTICFIFEWKQWTRWGLTFIWITFFHTKSSGWFVMNADVKSKTRAVDLGLSRCFNARYIEVTSRSSVLWFLLYANQKIWKFLIYRLCNLLNCVLRVQVQSTGWFNHYELIQLVQTQKLNIQLIKNNTNN